VNATTEHAPVDAWGPDFLGPGFEARTLELLPDDEDDGAVATLVRHLPALAPGALPGTPTTPTFIYLYLHGWNDYFFQTHLAREISRLGGAFYALDLRRYGRSWREGQMLGWCTSLAEYDEDLGRALSAIRAEQGWETELVLSGHSTGGLVASLWADRHPGALRALVLNSAWLSLQGSEIVRTVGDPVLRTLALRDPRMSILDSWVDPARVFSITDGWLPERDGELPDPAWADDPYVTGWDINPAWSIKPSAPVRVGWLQAVMEGHNRVAQGLDIRCPVLSMGAASTRLGVTWTPESRSADTIIDADATARRAVMLGNWEHRGAGSWRDAVAAWLPEGLDAWVIERELQDPVEYATMWLRDGGLTPERDPEAFDAALEAWIDDFEARDVRGVGFGFPLLPRPPLPPTRRPAPRRGRPGAARETVSGSPADR